MVPELLGLYEKVIGDVHTVADSIFGNSGRRAVEQAHIHKVSEEFEKLTRNSWHR